MSDEQHAARRLLQAVSARFDHILTDEIKGYDALEKRGDLTEWGGGQRSATARLLDTARMVFYDTLKLADELDKQARDATLNTVNCENSRYHGYFCGTKDDES